MNILIIGAGQVGKTVLSELSGQHVVSVIDKNPANLDEIPYEIDIFAGDGLDKDVLTQANLEKVDVLVATTSDDQTNLLISNTIKVLSDCYTIARVSDPSFVDTWRRSEGAFGVNKLVGRADLTARELVDLIGYQASGEGAIEEESFCDGAVELAEYRLPNQSPVANQQLSSLELDGEITVGAIIRDGNILLGEGDLYLKPGDKIAVLGTPNAVESFGTDHVHRGQQNRSNTIDILGGGEIGLRTAQLLQDSSLSVRLFEKNRDRAEMLSKKLPDTLVLHADITHQSIWQEEKITESDLVIVSTGTDERNLLCTHIGHRLGRSSMVSLVYEQEYLDLFESLDLLDTVHPREVVAESINNHVQDSYAEQVTTLDHDKMEVFETTLDNDEFPVQSTVEEVRGQFDNPFVLGALVRNGRVIVPRGSTELTHNDHLIILARADDAEDIAAKL